jgi:hypothetical protein
MCKSLSPAIQHDNITSVANTACSKRIRGLKAALKNPHVSEKAKEADRKKLHDLGEPVD